MIEQILTIAIWIFIIGIVGIVCYILYLESKFKHRIIIKDIRNGSKNVVTDKFEVKKKKDGSTWWKLKKCKQEIKPFPDECLETTNKGKIFASCYRLQNTNFIPIKDNFKGDKATTKKLIEDIDPFTDNQRSMLVNQQVKAERNKKKSIADMLTASIPYIALVMIIAVFLLFFGEAVEPMQEVGDQFVSIANQFEQVSAHLDEAINDKTYYLLQDDMSGDLINNTNGVSSPPN